MKTIFAIVALVAFTGCATTQMPVPATPTPPINEQRTLAQRIQALEDYLAQGDTPVVPPEVVSPSLMQEALQEVSRRIPQAQGKEAKVRFVSDRLAIVSVSYNLPDITTIRTQEVQFIFDGHVWNMFWIPETGPKNG
jgi:hypothetical protein